MHVLTEMEAASNFVSLVNLTIMHVLAELVTDSMVMAKPAKVPYTLRYLSHVLLTGSLSWNLTGRY